MFQLKNNYCILCFRQAIETDSAGLKNQDIHQNRSAFVEGSTCSSLLELFRGCSPPSWGGGRGTPTKIGWAYAAHFPKPLLYLRLKSVIFPSLFLIKTAKTPYPLGLHITEYLTPSGCPCSRIAPEVNTSSIA